MTVLLGEVCKFLNGGTPSRGVDRYFQGEIPWITGADITGPEVKTARSLITKEAIASSAANLVQAGTVLLVTRTSVGKVALAGMSLSFSQDITALLPTPHLDARYLVQFLRNSEPKLKRSQRGATIQGITRDVVEKLDIPLPPIEEQRRIAAILDQAEVLRTKRRQALAKLDTLTQSLFLEMFGDPDSNPKKWQRGRLIDYAIFENGDRSRNYPSGDDIKNSGVLFLNGKNIVGDRLVLSNCTYITQEKFLSISRGRARNSDLIITLRGTLGSCCVFECPEGKAFINAQMMIIRPQGMLLSAFLHSLLTSARYKGRFAGMSRGVAVPQLTSAQLADMQIIVPPLDLQQAFVKALQHFSRLKYISEVSSSNQDDLFASLQHRAFRGEL